MNKKQSDIDITKIVNHWVETSENDFRTSVTLYESKSYSWALFLGHISLEKLLKAVFVKKFGKHAPFTHNLYRLAELIEVEISEEYSDWLDEVTSFNLNARYDDYRKEFHSICTRDYTERWINNIIILRKWIKGML
ncbi:HEPN domain-containing protein [Natronoflexus pectinivorans]|uniref:HEPN domain-containing protein n=1 Tax=Natronoflexus pectinivorans TaxID=682526 RepID=A0A4V2RW99_9BACT|nr:HEPN domain-containing protein [Natronoflexus pectinivorans]TCO07415.1 HEPN domain-containing protein [Natronoflexus pectinivorans]